MKNFLKYVAILAATVVVSAHASELLLQNGGFENSNVSYGDYNYSSDVGWNVSAPSWNFSGLSGISASSGAWGTYAVQGTSFAFLQTALYSGAANGAISQSFNTTGTSDLTISFALAERVNCCGDIGAQIVGVSLDGVQLQAFRPDAVGNWSAYSLTLNGVSAGTHTLAFAGLNPTSSDTSAFVDNVQVAVVPEPSSLALFGIALAGFMGARRKSGRNKA